MEKPGMPDAVKTEHPHIVRLKGVCGGEPVIDGLRVAVRHVVTLHQRGETILDIAEALNITEAQVFHALSYFFDHSEEILALISMEEQAHPEFLDRLLEQNAEFRRLMEDRHREAEGGKVSSLEEVRQRLALRETQP